MALLPRRLLACAPLLVFGGLTGACDPTSLESPFGPRADQTEAPWFPTGVAVSPDGDTLAVVSSNWDDVYDTGAILLADLSSVDERLPGGSTLDGGPPTQIDPFGPAAWVTKPYYDAVYVPTLSDQLLFSDDGDHLFLTALADNRLVELEMVRLVGADGGPTRPILDCGVAPAIAGEPPLCVEGDHTINLNLFDPSDALLYDEDDSSLEGLVSYRSASEITFFRVRPERSGPGRFQRRGSIELGEEVRGIRGATLFPRGGGRGPLAMFAVERAAEVTTETVLQIAWLDPSLRADAQVRTFDVNEVVGAQSGRAMAPTPDGEALLLLGREASGGSGADALIRLEVTPAGNTVRVGLSGLGPVCQDPTDLEVVRVPLPGGGFVDRALVACYGDNTLAAFDPVTLFQTDVVRNFGLGPYSLAVAADRDVPRVFVSFFLDDTIGVFDLVDDAGEPRLVPRGRLGEPDLRERRQ